MDESQIFSRLRAKIIQDSTYSKDLSFMQVTAESEFVIFKKLTKNLVQSLKRTLNALIAKKTTQ